MRVWGDEFYRVVESLDGYTLVRDKAQKTTYYASPETKGTRLGSTGIPLRQGDAPLAELKALGVTPHLRLEPEIVEQIVANGRARLLSGDTDLMSGRVSARATSTGDVVGITLLIDFSDDTWTIAAAEFDSFLNSASYSNYGNNGSVWSYFNEVSNGHLNYTNYVGSSYYRAQNTKAYYISNDAALALVVEALEDLDDSGFNFADYDSDSDGNIDAVNVFYAGEPDSPWGQGLWPHMYSSTLAFFTASDGTKARAYQMTNIGTSPSIGTFCHENGHLICGFPDLYDYGYESYGVGSWCHMAFGTSSTNPCYYCAPLRIEAGWMDNLTELTTPQSDIPCATQSDVCYIYYNSLRPSTEYFVIENRKKSGRDAGLPGEGLAIWHVDLLGSNNYEQMTTLLHYRVSLEQADGDFDLENKNNYGDTGDLYYTGNVTEFSDATTPDANWWAGGTSDLWIHSVSASSDTMTFDFGESGSIYIAPITFEANGLEGGPFQPTSADYTLSNNSGETHDWSASVDVAWLELTAYAGTLNDGSATIVTASLNTTVNSLAVGTHTGTITFIDETTSDTTEADVTVNVYDIPSNTFLYFDLETDPGWSTAGDWAYGQPTGGGGAASGDNYGNPDPATGRFGLNVYGYNLSGNYANNLTPARILQTTALDCTDYENIHLNFWRWLNVEEGQYDQAEIYVSSNGVTWTLVWENPTYADVEDSDWTQVDYDISAIADGQATVYIRWTLTTDESYRFCGWNIDEIALTGINTNVPTPEISVAPLSLNFGDQRIDLGASAPSSFTITNIGDADLEFTSIEITGDSSSAFSFTATPSTASLSASESRTYYVTFDPDAEGAHSGTTVHIASNDPYSPTDAPSLSGNGLLPPDISVSPSEIDFGERNIDTGPSIQYPVTVYNTGGAPLEILSITIAGNTDSAFAFYHDPPDTSDIPAGGSRAYQITFDPSTTTTYTATLEITTDDPDEAQVDVPLTGVGTETPEPEISAAPGSLDFGELDIYAGPSAAMSITIENTGNAALEISALEFAVNPGGIFQFESFPGLPTLDPTETLEFYVLCDPEAEGEASGTLRIQSNDNDEATIDIPLSVTGTLPPPNQAMHWLLYY
ncbi:choice-of-anchor D domain-containing protein [Candidatus Sumerlaeota bacterium]|nr:choice-of-anchor D domain-containing protein [Candidatus Sumerlaeota bacterium]